MNDIEFAAKFRQAHAAARAQNWLGAQLMCDELLAKRKNDVNLLALRAHVAKNRMEVDEAVRLLERCVSLQPRDLALQLELARTLSWMGKYKQAISRFEKTAKLSRNHPGVVGGLADAFEHAGEPEKARALLEPWINAGNEDALMALVWARLRLSQKAPQDAVAMLARHASENVLPRAFLHTLGQAYERADNLDEAFAAYCRANENPIAKFDLHEFTERHRTLMEAYSRKTLATLPRPMHATDKAVFIAGRPRSGTTLVETILDSHPDVAGVGELPDLTILIRTMGLEIGSSSLYPKCIADVSQDDVNRFSSTYMKRINTLAPKAIRTVDKSLHNFEHLGLIQALLPQARIIHIRREPIDNCWATFVADMASAWVGSLRTQGIAYAFYERLMRHWREVLDIPILEIDYESLVDDQEGWTRRLIEFCGLPWDERCLRFYEHAAQMKEAISAPTISYNQVRQPIYKTSVGRAKKFDRFLGPLREGLEEGRRIAESIIIE